MWVLKCIHTHHLHIAQSSNCLSPKEIVISFSPLLCDQTPDKGGFGFSHMVVMLSGNSWQDELEADAHSVSHSGRREQ